MSDSNKSSPVHRPIGNRSESDSIGRSDGIEAGGLRQTDRPKVMPRNNIARVAIAGSFLFSFLLIAWAFSRPFVSTGPTIEKLSKDDLAKLEYEARLSPQQYVDFVRRRDDVLLESVRRKYEPMEVSLRPYTKREQWRKRVQQREMQLERMRKENDGEGFKKGTVEWQFKKDLESIADDSPPGI